MRSQREPNTATLRRRSSRGKRGRWANKRRKLTISAVHASYPADSRTRSLLRRKLLAVGTIRSRVSFFMNRFRKLGFVKYNGEIQV
jgi:hypothetical protein